MDNSVRRKIYIHIFFVFWTLLFFRLVKIQVIDHKRYLERARRNYIKPLRVPPLRGKILDRNGIVLADWKPIFRISVLGEKITKNGLQELARILHVEIDPDTIIGRPGYVRIKDGASLEEVISVEEREDKFPWVMVSTVPTRRYPYGPPLFHVLGYTGEVGPAEINSDRRYKPGDIIGKAGIEKQYEKTLRGKPGYKFYAVDATGRVIKTDPRPPIFPKNGKDITLTIDARLQLFVDSLFRPYKRGAAVVLDPRNGEILVLYSKPYADPNVLSMGISKDEWERLIRRKDRPLLNRCIAGVYPPGSIFKIITAAIGLEDGVVKPWEKPVICTGAYKMGNRIWRCWLPGGHGALDLYHAIEQSCDVYFYHLGRKIGLSEFINRISSLNIQRKVGIDLPGEVAGFVPTMEWYREKYGASVPEGLVLNLAIGQGEILLTPIEIAFLTALIARGATYTPHVVMRGAIPSISKYTTGFSDETLKAVREGMLLVVNGEKGTGRAARLEGIKVAGKTGTAENPHGKEHALFTAFAPYEDPEIVVTVVVENVGHGGTYAAPIAGKILERYFSEARK